MSKRFLFGIATATITLFLTMTNDTAAQEGPEQWVEHVEELTDKYNDPERAPLYEDEKADFKGINFFNYNPEANVKIDIKFLKKQKAVGFPTSTERIAMYRPFALLRFKYEGENHQLMVYRSAAAPEGDEHLFLPFTDNTCGVEAYGGGRYIDLTISALKVDNPHLDFNMSYHPYCAYSHHYSCPVPPQENSLNVRIEAGVKM